VTARRLLEPKGAVGFALVIVMAAGLLGSALERSRARDRAMTPEAVSRTGFVLAQALGGVRSGIAAYIWIKLDQAHHEYYGGAFSREAPLAPWYRIAAWLDPHMEKAFDVGSYIVFKQGREREAIAFAKEGLAANPDSVLLTFNLGQLYLFQQGNVAKREALRYLSRAEEMSRNADPNMPQEVTRLEILGSLNAVYTKWKIPNEPRRIVVELERLREEASRERKTPEAEPEEDEADQLGPDLGGMLR